MTLSPSTILSVLRHTRSRSASSAESHAKMRRGRREFENTFVRRSLADRPIKLLHRRWNDAPRVHRLAQLMVFAALVLRRVKAEQPDHGGVARIGKDFHRAAETSNRLARCAPPVFHEPADEKEP